MFGFRFCCGGFEMVFAFSFYIEFYNLYVSF